MCSMHRISKDTLLQFAVCITCMHNDTVRSHTSNTKIYIHTKKLYSLHQGGNEKPIMTNATALYSTEMVLFLHTKSVL